MNAKQLSQILTACKSFSVPATYNPKRFITFLETGDAQIQGMEGELVNIASTHEEGTSGTFNFFDASKALTGLTGDISILPDGISVGSRKIEIPDRVPTFPKVEEEIEGVMVHMPDLPKAMASAIVAINPAAYSSTVLNLWIDKNHCVGTDTHRLLSLRHI